MADPEHRTFESRTSRRISRQNKGHRSSDDVSMQQNEVSTPPSDITSAFMRLPPELRLNIYDYAVPATLQLTDATLSTHGEDATNGKQWLLARILRLLRQTISSESAPGHVTYLLGGVSRDFGSELGMESLFRELPGGLPALSRTSRSVRNEVLKHYFGRNTFVIDVNRPRYTLVWLRAMSPEDLGNMRRLLVIGKVERYDEAFRNSTPRTRLLFAIKVDLAAAGHALSIHKWSEGGPNTEDANCRLDKAASIIEDFTRRWNFTQASPADRKAGLISMLKKARYTIATPRFGLLPLRDQAYLLLEYAWFPVMLAWFFLNTMALLSSSVTVQLLGLLGGILLQHTSDAQWASLLRCGSVAEAAGMLD
ncbi:hypothetical protein LTR97_005617 [Elasticomyces elasticus]|uniref:F-box domain-containing protein n=1 Tax=Elasticomyces elasticus TaxID=574655 RepID=A0AAN7W8F8_9PEZI|nr:hypothetical protein LTR97_005617 [Elasticomyces elasticus]